MGDAGEGLIDAEGRIQERMEERQRERAKARDTEPAKPSQKVGSLQLARTQMTHQLATTTHPARRKQISDAIAEIDRQLKILDQDATG